MSDQTPQSPPAAPAAPMNVVPAPVMPPAMQIPPEVAQMIQAQREENARLRSQQTEAAIGQAVTAAIAENADRIVSPHAASHLAQLLRPQVRLIESGGQSVVAGPQLESVGQFVKDSLGRPEFAYLVKANGRGGTQANPWHPAPVNPAVQNQVAPPAAPQAPRNYAEAVLQFSRDRGIATPSVDPAIDVRSGFAGFRAAQPPRD